MRSCDFQVPFQTAMCLSTVQCLPCAYLQCLTFSCMVRFCVLMSVSVNQISIFYCNFTATFTIRSTWLGGVKASSLQPKTCVRIPQRTRRAAFAWRPRGGGIGGFTLIVVRGAAQGAHGLAASTDRPARPDPARHPGPTVLLRYTAGSV